VAPPDPSDSAATFDPLDTATRSEIETMLERAERSTGHPPLSEPSRLAWAGQGGNLVGLVLRSVGRVTGYAQLSWRDRSWTIEIALDPSDDPAAVPRRRLLEAATAEAEGRGASEVRYWVTQHTDDDETEVEALGFRTERHLVQMRVPLPLKGPTPPLNEGFSLRPFRPGHDEAGWLEVNNRAFATHPEQSHWDLTTLMARELTGWFDPEGFLLCESRGRLAGSCWTKVHADRAPALGEIYVISVDPDFQRLGLGKVLTVAGLNWLAERVSIGMLYVDAANAPAVELYRSLGFTVDHIDRCYLLERR